MGVWGTFLKRCFLEQRVYSVLIRFCVFIKLWLLKTGKYLIICSLDFAFARKFVICGLKSVFHVICVVEKKILGWTPLLREVNAPFSP